MRCCIASVKHCCIHRSCKQNKQTRLKRLCWIVGSFTAFLVSPVFTSFQTQMFPFVPLNCLNKFKHESLNETNETNKTVTSVCSADVVKCHQQLLCWSHLCIPALFSQSQWWVGGWVRRFWTRDPPKFPNPRIGEDGKPPKTVTTNQVEGSEFLLGNFE